MFPNHSLTIWIFGSHVVWNCGETCPLVRFKTNTKSPGMLVGYAQIDPHSGPELPLWDRSARLHVCIQDKNGASKGFEVIQVWPHQRFAEQLNWQLHVRLSRCRYVVENFVGGSQWVWPLVSVDCGRPSVLGMNQHCPSLILSTPDPSFGHSILKVCVNSAGGNRLTCVLDRLLEGRLRESFVVHLVCLNFDSVPLRICLKPYLCRQHLFCIC